MSAVPIPGSDANYSPASGLEAAAALDCCVQGIGAVSYLAIENGAVQEDYREMIGIACRIKAPRVTLDMAKTDLVDAWKSQVIGEETSLHVFADRAEGFDFRFALLRPNQTFITGVIRIERAKR